MDAKQVGLFIQELRKEKGITQKELADILHVSDKTISRWETGKGYPGDRNDDHKDLRQGPGKPVHESGDRGIQQNQHGGEQHGEHADTDHRKAERRAGEGIETVQTDGSDER